MKKKTPKYRKPAAIPAKARKSSGPMRNKREKRKSNKRRQLDIEETI